MPAGGRRPHFLANGTEKHIQSLGCRKLHPVLWHPDVISAPFADAPNMPVHEIVKDLIGQVWWHSQSMMVILLASRRMPITWAVLQKIEGEPYAYHNLALRSHTLLAVGMNCHRRIGLCLE